MIIQAPFTSWQVANLEDWQESNLVHPFTCPNRSDEKHMATDILIPKINGWICQYCNYTQDWAHDFMLSGRGLAMQKLITEKIRATKSGVV